MNLELITYFIVPYSETKEELTKEEKRKLHIVLLLLIFAPFVFAGVGYFLREKEPFWSVFAYCGSAILIVLLIFRLIHYVKDDYFKYKIVYKGTVLDVETTNFGYGTSSSTSYEFVLEKKKISVGERSLYPPHLIDVPLPAKGEQVEIHALPTSNDVIKLLILRNGEWKSVTLK